MSRYEQRSDADATGGGVGDRGGGNEVLNPFSPKPSIEVGPASPVVGPSKKKKKAPGTGLSRLARAGFVSHPTAKNNEHERAGRADANTPGIDPQENASDVNGAVLADPGQPSVAPPEIADLKGRTSDASRGRRASSVGVGAPPEPSVPPTLETSRDNDYVIADPAAVADSAGVTEVRPKPITRYGADGLPINESARPRTGARPNPRFGPDGLPIEESAGYARLMDEHMKRGDVMYGATPEENTAEMTRQKRRRFQFPAVQMSEWVGLDMPDLLLPWLFFVVILLPLALAYATLTLPSWIAIFAALCTSSQLISKSRGKLWKGLSVLCLLASLLGVTGGFYIHANYVSGSMNYRKLPHMKDVVPSSDPDQYRDAGVVQFSSSTVVDATRSVGMKSGDLYCVAPIVDPADTTMQSVNNWWAIGKNCCKNRNSFDCGDPTVHGGLVVTPDCPFYSPKFVKAARQASAVYGIPAPKDPMFIRWVANFDEEVNSTWRMAVEIVLIAALASLCIPIALVIIQVVARKSILEVTADVAKRWEWHPREAAHMVFGFGGSGVQSKALEQDLILGRCYWSGEVLHDYVFHVANSSLFVGVVAAHPAHPFSKVERFVLSTVICVTLVCLSAAAAALIDSDPIDTGSEAVLVIFVKLVLSAVAAVVPLTIVNSHLQTIVRKDFQAEIIGDKADTEIKDRPKLYLAISGTVLVVMTISIGCLQIIHACGHPVIQTVKMSLDVIFYVFAIGFALDVWKPILGGLADCDEFTKKTCFGFFGRWRLERESFLGAPEDFLWRSSDRYNYPQDSREQAQKIR
eukprot:TRINITY_DN42968_c0_g1_i1.p1 TRINITY_DN42968_c0_g1~~TRINITY_DN42968_c0_g1_i1.p1  ORF type:complete len:805 (-),score=119.93 TRINITY_DN42968_c0_g1_i1:96-2510(-)